MKSRAFLSLVLLASASGAAMAACGVNQITSTGGTQEVAVVTFGAIGTGATVTVAGLQIAATANRPDNQVAAAFGSLANGATTGAGVNVTYSGALNGWTSGAPGVAPASGNAQVAFTSVSFGSVPDIVVSSSTTPPTVATTQGTGSPSLSQLLTGNTACVASGPGWQNQEFHQSGGNLIDWKLGGSSTTDPTKSVGSWSVSGAGVNTIVTYNYGAQVFTYNVFFNSGNSYDFCPAGGGTAVPVTMKTGQGPCP